ncbi:MAG: hypothetical protein QXE80_09575, partial [Pyrobaculum sp.]
PGSNPGGPIANVYFALATRRSFFTQCQPPNQPLQSRKLEKTPYARGLPACHHCVLHLFKQDG